MDLMMRRRMMMQNPEEVISGVPPIVTNKRNLIYLKAFGGTEQNGTPTPDAPMDIVSNNGVLKARHQSGLPLGYTLLDKIIGVPGVSIIDTGIQGNNDNLKIIIKGLRSSVASYSSFFGNYIDEASNVTRIIAGSSSNQILFGLNRKSGQSTTISNISLTDLHTYELYKTQEGTSVLKVDGVEKGNSSNVQGNTNNTNIALGYSKVLDSPVSAINVTMDLYFCKIYDNDILVRDYIAAKRNSDNSIGFYDKVNNTFNIGEFPNDGPFIAGNEVFDPVEIYTDGTVETINVHGKNLLPPANIEENIATYYTDFPTNGRVGYHLSLKAGTYTFSVGSENYTTYLRHKYSGQEWSSYSTIRNGGTTQTYTNDVEIAIYSGSSGNNIENMLGRNVQIELGLTATEYAPYYNGGTATAEMLLKVGDYQDVQSIIGGVVTRKVGVKVLDGTENWAFRNQTLSIFYATIAGTYFNDSQANHLALSTNFLGVTVNNIDMPNNSCKCASLSGTNSLQLFIKSTNFASPEGLKSWLAAQYAAGTPVIVIYPLATPTTETVTGQTLVLTSGTNVIDITQASLDNLELEVKAR